jgi:hypothetical protein
MQVRASILGLAVLAAACSKGGSEPAATPSAAAPVAAPGKDACALVTADEAKDLLGGAVGTVQHNGGSAGYDQCQYLREGEHIADTGTLTVQRLPVTLAAKRQALAQNGDKFEDVGGVGDGAVWDPGMNFLYVAHGNETLMASVARNGIDMKAKSIELARLALPRM